jgi:hypothetical protein
VNDFLEIVPLAGAKFFLPDSDMKLQYLFVNNGSVPIEFKVVGNYKSMIIYPGKPDTLTLNINDLGDFEQSDHWVSFTLNYTLTKILPSELVTEQHSMFNIIPIAYRSEYPYKREYYNIPTNLTYSYTYDESDYYTKNIFRNHRARVFGSGYIDKYPSPYLAYYIYYRNDDYGDSIREE